MLTDWCGGYWSAPSSYDCCWAPQLSDFALPRSHYCVIDPNVKLPAPYVVFEPPEIDYNPGVQLLSPKLSNGFLKRETNSDSKWCFPKTAPPPIPLPGWNPFP